MLFATALALSLNAETCPADWKKNSYLAARDSVVSIDTVGVSIEHIVPVAGFVYPTRRHVVAIDYAGSIGRGLDVHFATGKDIHAHVIALDEARHVTILELDTDAPAAPLAISDRSLEVGDELIAVSPFENESGSTTRLDAWLHVGHVATEGDRGALRFDSTTPAVLGAPLLDCTGAVVGLRGWNMIVPSSDILAVPPGKEPIDDRKEWSADHVNAGLIVQGDDHVRLGASLGMAFVQGDRLQVRMAIGALASVPKTSDKSLPDDKYAGGRVQFEPTIGYRIMLTEKFPTYIVPQIGAVGRLDFESTTTTDRRITDVGCVGRGGPCTVESKGSTATTTTPSVAPILGVGFVIPAAALTYQVHLDPSDPARSTHQVFLGVEF